MGAQEIVKKIKADAPWGFQRRVAERAGSSTAHVNKFLCGKIRNSKLLGAVVDEFAEYQNDQQEMLSKLQGF